MTGPGSRKRAGLDLFQGDDVDKRVVIGAVVVVVALIAIVFSGVLGGDRGGATPTPIVAASPSASEIARGTPGPMGSIAATVSFKGTAPATRKIKKTPECGADPLVDDEITVADGKLANVLVRVVAGVPPQTGSGLGVEITQEKCVYSPRVAGIVAGQSIAVTSKDAFLHNVHTFQGDVSIFNKGQPAPSTFTKESADFAVKGEVIKDGPITFKCDVHPWMVSHVVVNPNPYFAVSGANGIAAISLPAGKYTLEAWHEKLGVKRAEVTVDGEKPVDLAFEFP